MEQEQTTTTQSTVLSGWKEIARYLGRGVRTVQRWERYGLPISRPNGHVRSSVCTTSAELDEWLHRCRSRPNVESNNSVGEGCAHVQEISELKREVARLNIEVEKLSHEVTSEPRTKLDRLGFPPANSKLADA